MHKKGFRTLNFNIQLSSCYPKAKEKSWNMKIKDLDIRIKDKEIQEIYQSPSCLGEIQIGDFKETFDMSLDSWSIEEYTKQWAEGFARIKEKNLSCLIANAQNPKRTAPGPKPLINLWLLYREKDIVYIQNQLLFGSHLKELANKLLPFDSNTCYSYIKPRETINEDGKIISEWKIEIDEL